MSDVLRRGDLRSNPDGSFDAWNGYSWTHPESLVDGPAQAACRQRTVESLFDEIRAWLRAHSDYDVHLDLWSLYGCYRVAVTRFGDEVWSDLGENLDKRLSKALEYLRGLEAA